MVPSLFSQLAAGAAIEDVTKPLEDDISNGTRKVQEQAASAIQTVQDAANSATHDITLQIQAALSNTRQYASSLQVNSQEAQTLIQACLTDQAKKYEAIANATRK
jgi:hypothetical protein